MDLAPYSSPNKVRVQTGFAARLTSTYSSSTGYSWEMLVLSSGQSPKVKRITGPLTGRYAFTPDDNQVLTVGTKGWLEPDPQGRGYIFLRSKAAIAADCAWVAGITTTDCLMLTVVATSGACSGVDDDQEILLEWDAVDSRWESGLTDWTGTGSGGSGPAHFGKTNGLPYLTLDGQYLTFLGCEDDGLLFAGGGAVLCGGTSEACADYFVVRLECIDCPPVGWDGSGWYCLDEGDGCPGSPTYLTLSTIRSTDVICSGPYATAVLAYAACPGGTVDTECCPDMPWMLCVTITGVTGGTGNDTLDDLTGIQTAVTYQGQLSDGSHHWCGDQAITSDSPYTCTFSPHLICDAATGQWRLMVPSSSNQGLYPLPTCPWEFDPALPSGYSQVSFTYTCSPFSAVVVLTRQGLADASPCTWGEDGGEQTYLITLSVVAGPCASEGAEVVE